MTRVPTTINVHGTRYVGEITCTINNSDLKLLPNTNVNVNVVTAKDENALTVPREAIHQEDGQRYVFQIVGDHLERRPVQTSISNLTSVEVTQGLPNNAMVALSTTDNKPLRNGLPVRVVSQ